MDADLMRALRDAQSGDPDALRAATTALVRAGYRDERVVLVIDNGESYSDHALHFVEVTGLDVEAAKAALLTHGDGIGSHCDSFVDSTARGDWDGTARPFAECFGPPAYTVWLNGDGRETRYPRWWTLKPGDARPVPLRTELDPSEADALEALRPFASVLAEAWRDPARIVQRTDRAALVGSWAARCAVVCEAWGVEWRGMLPDKGES